MTLTEGERTELGASKTLEEGRKGGREGGREGGGGSVGVREGE